MGGKDTGFKTDLMDIERGQVWTELTQQWPVGNSDRVFRFYNSKVFLEYSIIIECSVDQLLFCRACCLC
jgi:hypothetical protein